MEIGRRCDAIRAPGFGLRVRVDEVWLVVWILRFAVGGRGRLKSRSWFKFFFCLRVRNVIIFISNVLCLCGNGNRGLLYGPELICIATRLCVCLVIRAVFNWRVVYLFASKTCTLLQIWKQSAGTSHCSRSQSLRVVLITKLLVVNHNLTTPTDFSVLVGLVDGGVGLRIRNLSMI